jgi:hypothetical protein
MESTTCILQCDLKVYVMREILVLVVCRSCLQIGDLCNLCPPTQVADNYKTRSLVFPNTPDLSLEPLTTHHLCKIHYGSAAPLDSAEIVHAAKDAAEVAPNPLVLLLTSTSLRSRSSAL